MVYKHLPLLAILLLIGCTTGVVDDDPNQPVTPAPTAAAAPTDEIPEATAGSSADTTAILSENKPTAPTVTSEETVFSESTETPTVTPFPLATPQSTNTPYPTEITPTKSAPTITLNPDCPSSLESDQPSLWTTGSILFESEDDIWAISANNPTPQLIYATDDNGGYLNFYIENGANKILVSNYLGPEGDSYTVYDLVSQSVVGMPVESSELLIPIGGRSVEWLPDNRARFAIDIERVDDVGETRTYLTVDPITGQTEVVREELDLPGYTFIERPAYIGVASVDPTGQLVLYSAWNGQNAYDFVLRDRDTGDVIWKQESLYWPGLPVPEPHWEKEGRSVLFSADILNEARGYGVLSLSRDGEVLPLPPQPFPLTEQWERINSLNRSPEGRYISYHLGAFPNGAFPDDATGPGVIVDTMTEQAGQICDDSQETDSTFYGGQWISEELFLYRVKTGDGKMSLRVLDVPSWTMQELAEIQATRFYDNAYGWTPVEFSDA
jgi:hypothetical protein